MTVRRRDEPLEAKKFFSQGDFGLLLGADAQVVRMHCEDVTGFLDDACLDLTQV